MNTLSHSRTHTFTRLLSHIRTDSNAHSDSHTHTHTQTRNDSYIHTHLHCHAHIHTHTHMQTHAHAHTHTHTHTLTHTHTHTHKLTHTPLRVGAFAILCCFFLYGALGRNEGAPLPFPCSRSVGESDGTVLHPCHDLVFEESHVQHHHCLHL